MSPLPSGSEKQDLDREEPETPERLEPVNRLSSIGLPVTLAICIVIALILTSISIGLYFNSNLSRIDLSKPKYADIRGDVLSNEPEEQQEELDSDSPITREAIQEAIVEMKQRREDLRQLGDFDSEVLENAQLGIGTQER